MNRELFLSWYHGSKSEIIKNPDNHDCSTVRLAFNVQYIVSSREYLQIPTVTPSKIIGNYSMEKGFLKSD